MTALPPDVARGLDAAGLNLRASLSAQRWNDLVPAAWRTRALLPGARSALLLASGGRALWRAFRGSPERSAEPDPLDAYSVRVTGEAVARLAAAGFPSRVLLAFERREGVFADFVALAAAAGLGAPSRLGLLVHPEYGPWLSIRAALLTTLDLPEGHPVPGFDPCRGCPAPCAQACHGAAVAEGGFDVGACAATRAREPACALRCDARRACVLGRGHAYAADAEAHHMRRSGARAGASGA